MGTIQPTPYKPASQDFRDGAASGAGSMAWRIRRMHSWGIPITPELVDKLAETIAYDMGGSVWPMNES